MSLRVMISDVDVRKAIGEPEATIERVEGFRFLLGICAMNCGMQKLDAANLGDWVARLQLMQMLYGPFGQKPDGSPFSIDAEFLYPFALAGVTFNVPPISDAAFRKDVFGRILAAAKVKVRELNTATAEKVFEDGSEAVPEEVPVQPV